MLLATELCSRTRTWQITRGLLLDLAGAIGS